MLVNIGTGSQISVLSDSWFEGPGIEARPLTADSYLLVGAALCGGAAYAALEHFFREYAAAAGGKDQPQYGIMQSFLTAPRGSAQDYKDYLFRHAGKSQRHRLRNRHPAGQLSSCRHDPRRSERHGPGTS